MSGPVSAVSINKFPGANVASSGSSASVSIPNDSAGNAPKYMRLNATAAAWVRWGKGAQTAVAGDCMVQPGDSLIVTVGGADTLACLQVSAGGTVGISALENY